MEFSLTEELPVLHISYKPQKISPKSQGTVRVLLHEKIRDAYVHPQFCADVMKPLKIDEIIDQEVQNLSGGELQRVALALCLGKPADVYLVDEPSAYLDSEQRLIAAKVIKRYESRFYFEQELTFLSFQIHSSRKENWFYSRARFHNGNVFSGSCNCI